MYILSSTKRKMSKLPIWKFVKSVKLKRNEIKILKDINIYCCSDVVSPFNQIDKNVNDNNNNNNNNNNKIALINPCNQTLSGTALPYFPIGGPLPVINDDKLSNSNSWGGMSAGSNMNYPAQAVDGIVHMEGGRALVNELKKIPIIPMQQEKEKEIITTTSSNKKVHIGSAVHTLATGRLKTAHGYNYIIHTPPPFYNDENSQNKLMKCYLSSIKLCLDLNIDVLCSPLLGGGTAGFPKDIAFQAFLNAMKVLTAESNDFITKNLIIELRLTIQSMEDAKMMSSLVEKDKDCLS